MGLVSRLQYGIARLRGSAPLGVRPLPDPVRFSVPSRLAHEKVRTVDGEREVLRRLLEEVRPGDVVCDVGANFGLYTVPLAHAVSRSGTVHAFEPASPWFRQLLVNLVLNDLGNVEPFRVALGAEKGEARLARKESAGSGMGSLCESYTDWISGEPSTSEAVRVCTLDQMVEVGILPTPNVIKIDVEGTERAVIEGARTVLRSSVCRRVLTEVHVDLDPGLETAVDQELEAAGLQLLSTWRRGGALLRLDGR